MWYCIFLIKKEGKEDHKSSKSWIMRLLFCSAARAQVYKKMYRLHRILLHDFLSRLPNITTTNTNQRTATSTPQPSTTTAPALCPNTRCSPVAEWPARAAQQATEPIPLLRQNGMNEDTAWVGNWQLRYICDHLFYFRVNLLWAKNVLTFGL